MGAVCRSSMQCANLEEPFGAGWHKAQAQHCNHVKVEDVEDLGRLVAGDAGCKGPIRTHNQP